MSERFFNRVLEAAYDLAVIAYYAGWVVLVVVAMGEIGDDLHPNVSLLFAFFMVTMGMALHHRREYGSTPDSEPPAERIYRDALLEAKSVAETEWDNEYEYEPDYDEQADVYVDAEDLALAAVEAIREVRESLNHYEELEAKEDAEFEAKEARRAEKKRQRGSPR